MGATPLRGAVWVEIQSHPSVEISPKRVVLYDNATTVTVTLRVIDEVTKDAAWPVLLIPTSCDSAFEGETIIALEVVAPAPSRGSRNHNHRKYKKRLETGFIIVARSLSLGSTNRSSPARPSRAVADAPPPARPHISWALPEHKSYLQTSQTHVAVVQRISLPPPDE